MSWVSNLGQSIWDIAKAPISAVPGIGNYLGSLEAADATKDANEKNLQAVRETNAANAALWREQSAYNTPENQVHRLRDAGLNPMLAYGTVAEGRAASAPTMQAPEVRPVPARDYSKFSLAEYQQIQNMQEQNALIRAQNNEVTKRAEGISLENTYKAYENKLLMESGALRNDTTAIKTYRFLKDKIQQYNNWLDTESSKRR